MNEEKWFYNYLLKAKSVENALKRHSILSKLSQNLDMNIEYHKDNNITEPTEFIYKNSNASKLDK